MALTSHLIKVFEKVIRNHLVYFLESNNLFNPSQHGFRKGRSCLSELLCHMEEILHELSQGKNVDVVYLDYAKAFDKVDFNVLLKKLKHTGIQGKLLQWIESFITGRSQAVVVNGVLSDISKVLSGVPQGSVLGPLLFLLLIGDIDLGVVGSSVKSFADDTRVVTPIASTNDISTAQHNLNIIYDWTSASNLEFNTTKFELL